MTLVRQVGIFSLPTGGATVDFTISGFGTPKMAEFYACYGVVQETVTNHAVQSRGVTNGTNQWTVAVQSENASGSSDADRSSTTAQCLRLLTAGTVNVNGELSFNSWITDGVRCNVDNAFAAGYQVIVVLTKGSDVTCDVGTMTVGTNIGNTASISSLNATPDFVEFAGIHATATTTTGTRWHLDQGICVNDGTRTQRAHISRARNGTGAAEVGSFLATNRCIGGFEASTSAVDWAAELTSFDANGFTITTRDSAAPAGTDVFWIAVTCPSNSVWLSTQATPTATGNDAVTGLGFKPGFLRLQTHRMSAVDTAFVNTEAGIVGVSLMDDTTQGSLSTSDEDGQGTTDTSSVVDNKAVIALGPNGNVDIEADFVSFDTDGYTLNWTNIDPTARQWYAFAIQETAGGTTDGAGSASGAATVSGVGESTAAASGSSAGAGTVSGVGAAIFAATGTSSAAATVSGVGESTHAATASAAGAATVSGVGSSTTTVDGAGSAAGSATVSGVGESTAEGSASSTGTSTVSGVGRATSAATASAAGSATVSGTGSAITEADATATGTATVSGVGEAITAATASAAGTATVSGVGESTHEGVGSVSGTATVSGVGETIADGTGVGSAAGTSTVSGVGESTASATAASTGSAVVAGTGASIAEGVGASTGSATVSGVGTDAAQNEGVGSSVGSATVSGVGVAIFASVGSASGIATVSGVGSAGETEGVGAASGSATVSGVGVTVLNGVGSSIGIAAVSGVGQSTHAGVGVASGSATVLALGSSISSATGAATGAAAVNGVGSDGTVSTPRLSFKARKRIYSFVAGP